MSSLRFLIRADASRLIGSGHVVRCITLARALLDRGHRVEFVCRDLPGNLQNLIRDNFLAVKMLPAMSERALDSVYPVEQQLTDCRETIELLEGETVDCVIVDHYGLDQVWQSEFGKVATQIVVIDDIANRKHICGILIDPNYSNSALTKYEGLVPPTCRQLIGPKYALLHSAYTRQRQHREHTGDVNRIFVYFGGTDEHDLTGTTARALLNADRPGSGFEFKPELKIDIVIGRSYGHYEHLMVSVGNDDRVTLHGSLNHLADLMIKADLSIGAGGGTGWERMCLGLPSIVVSLAANQEPACKALAEKQLIHYLGPYDKVSQDDILQAVKDAVANKKDLVERSNRGMLEVDGLGALRVVEQIDPTSDQLLTLREARKEDIHLYFNWANDGIVRSNALNPNPIEWDQHERWFIGQQANKSTVMLLLCARDLPVGQIRFEIEDRYVRISYSLDADYRGRRWGKILVGLGLHYFCDQHCAIFRAEVKKDNGASLATLKGLGFEESNVDAGGDVLELHLNPQQRPLMPVKDILD